jgi:hypothetical protein
VATREKFAFGDRVVVPWGFHELVGVVREVYGPAGARSVLVEVPVQGASGEVLEVTTVSYSASVLRPATS